MSDRVLHRARPRHLVDVPAGVPGPAAARPRRDRRGPRVRRKRAPTPGCRSHQPRAAAHRLARLRARAGDERWRSSPERVAAIAGTSRGAAAARLHRRGSLRSGLARRDPEAAAGEAERVRRVAGDGESPWLRGMVATWLAPDAVVPGPPLAPPDELERAGRWIEAADAWQRLGCPFEQALALARSGEPGAVRRSMPLFEALGAEAAAARARLLLRAQGLPTPRSPRATTRAPPGRPSPSARPKSSPRSARACRTATSPRASCCRRARSSTTSPPSSRSSASSRGRRQREQPVRAKHGDQLSGLIRYARDVFPGQLGHNGRMQHGASSGAVRGHGDPRRERR